MLKYLFWILYLGEFSHHIPDHTYYHILQQLFKRERNINLSGKWGREKGILETRVFLGIHPSLDPWLFLCHPLPKV
jgi:hypothetical protein